MSLHEPGPSRFALTTAWVRRTQYIAPEGKDWRLAVEWKRPRSRPPRRIARAFSIIVPYDEVIDRRVMENGQIVWVPMPPENTCIHFDVVYTPSSAVGTSHPGARSMGTGLIGAVQLENGEQVFVTWLVRPMDEATRRHILKLRSTPILDAGGNLIQKSGMLAFGRVPNPDADDGTHIGTLLDVTRRSSANT